MIAFILWSFLTMAAIVMIGFYEYWTEVVKPVNLDILEGLFSNQAEAIHSKIIDARTYNDVRKIQTNLLATQKKYSGKVRARIMEPVMRKLWGELDCRCRLIIYQNENKLRQAEVGTMTINDLINEA